MLAAGGSAADAAVAAQMVLNVVEPQSSGIGGGGFALYWDAALGELASFDGRETAPAAATPDYWLDAEGAPMEFWDAVPGGRSVGVPGTLKLMETLHQRYGRLPWGDALPARHRARRGRLSRSRRGWPPRSSTAQAHGLDRFPAARALYFHQDGSPQDGGRDPDQPRRSPAPSG